MPIWPFSPQGLMAYILSCSVGNKQSPNDSPLSFHAPSSTPSKHKPLTSSQWGWTVKNPRRSIDTQGRSRSLSEPIVMPRAFHRAPIFSQTIHPPYPPTPTPYKLQHPATNHRGSGGVIPPSYEGWFPPPPPTHGPTPPAQALLSLPESTPPSSPSQLATRPLLPFSFLPPSHPDPTQSCLAVHFFFLPTLCSVSRPPWTVGFPPARGVPGFKQNGRINSRARAV